MAVTDDKGNLHAVGVALMGAAMALPLCAVADTAPERGLISLKYLDYLDSQPDQDRIRVHATALKIMAPVAGQWALGGTLTSDGISGASPAYHTLGLGQMHDRRNAVDTDVTRFFQDGSLTVGASYSKESDYLSRGLSVQGSANSEDRNTTWTFGLGHNKDAINPTNNIVSNETKDVTELLWSLTQVVTMNDIVQFSFGASIGHGYFSDPYKVFDNRPRDRHSQTLMGRWNHHIAATDGTLRLNYRYFSDSWKIRAHTMGLEYVQPLANGWSLTPMLRLYTQSAASFFVDSDLSTYPFPPNPPAAALNYSEDQRVSAYGAATVGLKVAKQLNRDWQLDFKLENYTQRSSWRLFGDGSPGLAPFNARSIQIWIARQF